ncbi:MAG TPA: 16S rRNA processing protein RimM [Blastocatellia bacterium]|nr:16S rRNA processing protein RimM [Blastocatellia bacterium]
MKTPREQTASDLIVVARAVRTRGLKGEIVAELLTDFPERFQGLSAVFAVGLGEQKSLELENHWFQNDRIVLKFAGYDDVEAAKSLIGFDFALPEAERMKLSENEYYDWELEGCSVVIKDGPTLGTVRGVLRTGGVELLAVQDENAHEHLVPMVESFVIKIDISRREILIDPPEGLLEL